MGFSDEVLPSWENVFEAIGHPTMILDKNHTILKVNQATLNLVEMSQKELVGRPCFEIFHSTTNPPKGCPMETLLFSNKLETNDMLLEAMGRYYLVSCTPVLDSEGKLVGIIHIATDVTARYLAEEEVEAMFDIMAHDLRNRLQVTLLGAEIVRENCHGKASEEATVRILDTIDSLKRLIDKVQSIRGFLIAPFETRVLEEEIMLAVKLLRVRFPSAHVSMQIDVQDALIRADSFIQNMLLNILENAVVHNHTEPQKVWINAYDEADHYRIDIIDNGQGIPIHEAACLLDPGRRFGGIGIAQAYRIAKKYSGTIQITPKLDDAPRTGAMISIMMPKVGKSVSISDSNQ